MSVETAPDHFIREIERYLRQVEEADEYGAVDLALGMLDQGTPPQDVLLRVIVPAQRRVGQLWAANRWTVAHEHAATAISERAVAAVISRVRPTPTHGHVLVACVEGEQHALPTRLLAEVLRLHGWQIDFLGADVPTPHLVARLQQTGPDVVALGCTVPAWLPRAHATITACQAAGVPVLAGGAAFGADGRFARMLGADSWAPTADAAADLLRTGPPSPAEADDDPAPRVNEEYEYLIRHRGDLLPRVLELFACSFPSVSGEDLGQIAEFLGAALYLDDSALFTDFVTWTCSVSSARGVPCEAVVLGLAIFRSELTRCPRARALLAEGMKAAGAACGTLR